VKDNMKDRRQLPRYPLQLQVKEINGSPVMDTYLLDIGPLGARMKTTLPFNATDLVELIVLLTDKEKERRLLGEVVWLDFSMATQGYFILGISFLQPCWDLPFSDQQ